MKKKILCKFVIAAFIITAGCTTLKRYSSLSPSGTDNSLASIDLFSSKLITPEPENSGKSLWDLSADAQSQFIKILNNRYPSNEMFLNSISNVYLNRNEGMPSTDYVRKDLRLIFSVSRKRGYEKTAATKTPSLSPADRLEYIRISLVARDSSLRFTEWNLYSTDYGSIDIGDVSFGRSLDVTASVSGPAKKEGPDLSAEAKSSLSRKEDQSVKYRYIKLNGRMNDRGIEMEEEGTRETDLAGNIVIGVSLGFVSASEIITRITGLRDSSGRFNGPEKLSLDSYEVSVPDIKKKKNVIEADLKMDFIYRNVIKGSKTFPEWDDRVKYYYGSVTKPVVLFKDTDYIPGFCALGSGQGDKKQFVVIRKPDGETYPLIFRTYGEATAFHDWLVWFSGKNKGRSINAGGCTLQFMGRDLMAESINSEFPLRVIPWYW